jgi:hypothetical protein
LWGEERWWWCVDGIELVEKLGWRGRDKKEEEKKRGRGRREGVRWEDGPLGWDWSKGERTGATTDSEVGMDVVNLDY